jgi:hypothetical protein
MNNDESNPEREFLLTGLKTYLDVHEAIAEFEDRVREDCNAALMSRLNEINSAFKMSWTEANMRDYTFTDSSHRAIHLGRKILTNELGNYEGGLYFALALSPAKDGSKAEMLAYLYRDNTKAAADFWNRLSLSGAPAFYSKGSLECGVKRPLTLEAFQDFREPLTEAIDILVVYVKDAGGLKSQL